MSGIIDLHIHTTASDGTDRPEALPGVAAFRIFSVTDHDTIAGSEAVAAMALPGVRYIRGIEFSCVCPGGKCHILGYGYDPADEVFQEALAEGARLRREKLERRLAALETHFGIRLTAAELEWLLRHCAPGKPHLGRILMERGLAPDLSAAIRTYIDPFDRGDDRISAAQAIRAILHAGGIPVWAHPLGGEGERRLSRAEFARRLAVLTESGIRGLECCYSRYGDGDIAFLLDRARERGLLVSGGSDYHGGNKAGICPGMLNARNAPVDPGVLTILDALL